MVALVVGLAAAPACAQRGGGHGGGGGGHAGFAAQGGFSHAGGYGGGFRSGYAAGGSAYAPRYGAQGRVLSGGLGVSGARPAFYGRGWDRRRYGHRYGVAYGYGAPLDYGWLDANDPGYDGDDGSYDVGPYDDGSGVAAEGYGQAPPYDEQPSGDEQPIPYQGPYPPENAEPAPVASAPTVVAAPALYDNDAVTLVFKDGRAPEKIHNYALTRTTLYVTDGRRREIPVAALDMAATEKVNRAAGLSFQLPVTP